jgi:hypothetical protein
MRKEAGKQKIYGKCLKLYRQETICKLRAEWQTVPLPRSENNSFTVFDNSKGFHLYTQKQVQTWDPVNESTVSYPETVRLHFCTQFTSHIAPFNLTLNCYSAADPE